MCFAAIFGVFSPFQWGLSMPFVVPWRILTLIAFAL